MAATWKTKWGVRRVRRDTPTIEEALIAAESLANDPAQRAEIAASLMGMPVEEVKVLAAKQAARTRKPRPRQPQHDYATCTDKDCTRHPCLAYRQGLEDCPLPHGG